MNSAPKIIEVRNGGWDLAHRNFLFVEFLNDEKQCEKFFGDEMDVLEKNARAYGFSQVQVRFPLEWKSISPLLSAQGYSAALTKFEKKPADEKQKTLGSWG